MVRSRRKRSRRGGEIHPIHKVKVEGHHIAQKLTLRPRKKTLKERIGGTFTNTGNQIKHAGRAVKEGTGKLLNRIKHLFSGGGSRRRRTHHRRTKRHHRRTRHRRRTKRHHRRTKRHHRRIKRRRGRRHRR